MGLLASTCRGGLGEHWEDRASSDLASQRLVPPKKILPIVIALKRKITC